MNYRIYENNNGWYLVATTNNPNKMIQMLENMIENNIRHFIVVEHNKKENYDIPIIVCEADLIDFKEERKEKNKRLIK